MQHRISRLLLRTAASVALAGCADGSAGADCRVGAECASGVCESGGTCRPVANDSTGFIPGEVADDAGPTETSDTRVDELPGDVPLHPDTPPLDIPDNPAPACQPNSDGTVSAAEAPFPTGVTVTFRTALGAPVDLVGETVDGERTWDLSAPAAGDTDLPITTEQVLDQWFAGLFQGASYAARLTAQNSLLGVFRRTDSALQLLGVVSPEAGTLRTELIYDPPVDLLRFPVTLGAEWMIESKITGRAEGVPCTSVGGCMERYRFEVDAAGTVLTPFGAFPSLRVRTELDRKVGLVTQVSRSFQWVVECFGIVATVNSQVGETQIEFSSASELRRLAPWSAEP